MTMILAGDLIEVGSCDEGLQTLEEMENQIPTGDEQYRDWIELRSVAHACLGEIDKAIEDRNASILLSSAFNHHRTYSQALYLYQAGRNDEALSLLNQSLDRNPSFFGARYYSRGLINLSRGNEEQARQDLDLGARYTWDRGGTYAYLNGKLALADGNQEEAIYWLQQAEVCFFRDASLLREQAQQELEQLGAEVLDVSLSVPFQATPMPPLAP